MVDWRQQRRSGVSESEIRPWSIFGSPGNKFDHGRCSGRAMKQCFRPKSFYEKNSRLITECNAICQTLYDDRYALTLRQLFYQLVSRNRIKNTEREYKNLGVLISDARYAGLIDWDHIVDRIRVLNNDYGSHFTDPEDIINYFTESFRVDVWKDQDVRPEVWVEKDALIQVVANICEPLGVPYIAVKAYSSTSAQWAGRRRFRQYIRDGAKPVILHLGDHDATGVDCSRHLKEEMELLVGSPIELRRLALTPAQIEKYELPP